MGTPHNEAAQGAFAKTVLMPGDPLRAKFIAEHFLDGAKLVNNVRGVQGYTGTYRDTPVSVMASGMGMPSMGIYSYELFHTYDVDNIIRVGSVGSISPRLKLRDVVLGQAACTDSNYPRQYGLDGTFSPIADFTLLESAVSAARRLGVKTAVGNLLSSDVFYRPLHHRAPDLLHPDDHPRPGGGRGHGRPARVNGRGKSRPSGRLFPRETIREDITPVGHVLR